MRSLNASESHVYIVVTVIIKDFTNREENLYDISEKCVG